MEGVIFTGLKREKLLWHGNYILELYVYKIEKIYFFNFREIGNTQTCPTNSG